MNAVAQSVSRANDKAQRYPSSQISLVIQHPLALLRFILGNEYLPSVFLSHLNQILLELVFGGETFLLISAPPRHGKSKLCSHALPAWFLGLFPKKRVLLGSYEATFAKAWGRETRDTLSVYGQALFGVRVRPDVSAGSDWEIHEYGGGMITAGVEGGFTGKGGDLIVIEDPVKNRAEAESQVYRDAVWRFFNSTAWPRREPGAKVLVIMQRWHQDDLIGRIKREMPQSGYREINFPAIAEEEDALGRKPGDALFPARYPIDELLKIQRDLVPYYWNSQYQQRPSDPHGAIFLRENWRYYGRLPEKVELLYQSWDMAFKGTADSNPVAGQVWAKAGPDYYLVDRVNRKMGFTDSLQAVRDMKKIHPRSRAILVEDKANGPAVIDVLRREIPGVIPITPEGGKIVRAHAVEPTQRSGNVFLPEKERHPWVKEFVEQCAEFPGGVEDDDVDAFTQAINWAESRPSPGAFVVG